MQTKSFYFKNKDNHQLFGEIHYPSDDSARNKGVVICYPFGEERIRSHRVIYNLAKEMQKAGYTVLRFDYWGQGDSEGEWESAGIETRIADIKSAIAYLRENTEVEDIGLLGLRFGATLAKIAASDLDDLKCLILLDPILLPGKYIYDSLRGNLASQVMIYKKIVHTRDQMVEKIKDGETINVDGFEIGNPLYEQAEKVNLLASQYETSAKILVMEIKINEAQPDNAQLKEYVNKLIDEKKTVSYMACVSQKYWALLNNYYPVSEDMNNKALEWINGNL